MKVKSESEVTQSCPTPSDPMDCSLPGSSIHGIFQTRVMEWGAISFSNSDLQLSSCPTLCDRMNRSTPGLPVYHQLPEFTQILVHRVSDAIQPSHPLSSPSPPASIFPSIRVFSNKLALPIRWPKDWSFSFSPSNEYSGLVSFRIDWFYLLAVQWTIFFSTINRKHQFFCTQPTLWSNSHICT